MVNKHIRPENNPLAGIKFENLFTNPELYLCGQPIKKVFEHQFFESLNHYTLCGFCYGLSTITMLMLKDDPTSKIVQGLARSAREREDLRHCWVEIERNGEKYVIDFGWFPWYLQPIPLEWYYDPRIVEAKPLWTCYNREFWQRHLTKILFEKCSHPQTSWVLPQIIWCSTPPDDPIDRTSGYGFRAHDVKYLRSPKVGRIMIPQAFRFNSGIIDAHVIKELMQPGLVEVSPKTRYKAEKQYRKLCRKVHTREII